MERWRGKIAVVTGTSSGIGEATARNLLKYGIIVIGLARRENRLKENKSKLPKEHQKNYYPKKCDVSKDDQVKEIFGWIEKKFGGVDILVNNAGIWKNDLLHVDNNYSLKETIDVNVMGVVYCTREAFKSMKNRNVAGHVICLNSILGHSVLRFPGLPQRNNIYTPSKYAVTAMTEIYRQEFNEQNTKVKITSISPSIVDTEIWPHGVEQLNSPYLKPDDVSDAIVYVLGTQPHVQIHELTIRAIGEVI